VDPGIPATPSAPEAAVALVRAERPQPSILLIQRAINPKDPWSGHWSFPGGRWEPGDPDLLSTALRELAEECGLSLDRHHCQTSLPADWAGRRVGRFVLVAPFVFQVEKTLPVQVDQSEATRAVWLPESTFSDLRLHRWQSIPGLPADRRFPAIPLEGTPLWGFTYRVLCQWLSVPEPQDEVLLGR
jgi:8-oxo-dGTP pyrophosphatase MutT (NUDIX family)